MTQTGWMKKEKKSTFSCIYFKSLSFCEQKYEIIKLFVWFRSVRITHAQWKINGLLLYYWIFMRWAFSWELLGPTKTAHAKTGKNTQPNKTNKNCPIIHPHVHINTYMKQKRKKATETETVSFHFVQLLLLLLCALIIYFSLIESQLCETPFVT